LPIKRLKVGPLARQSLKDRQVKLAEARGVGDHVDLDDLPAPNREAKYYETSRRYAGAAWLADLSDRLQQVSPEFRTWWSQHKVQQQRERAIVMQHPRVGRLVLERVVFVVEATPSLSLRVLLPLPDADTAAKLHRLWAEPG
jgi:hypothetical protein